MSEVGGLLWLVAGLGSLSVAAGLVACCLRIESPVEFLLATYVLAWAWLVGVTLLLSPPGLVTRGWLTVGIAVGVGGAVVAWFMSARPTPPSFREAIAAFRVALRRPAVAVLAVVVGVGAAYTFALAIFTSVVEGDAHAYHLARAAFWKQSHELGYVANALESRLNVNPPNAEIGQLATMLLSGSDRYVALPQFAAYAALTLCVAGLGRRIGLSIPESLFGALAFATLPVVVVQASGALNDLVVASFLATAAYFALRPARSSLLLFALALGLAVGTKFTAVLALPTLALIVVVTTRPARRVLMLAGAAAVGLALGSTWYVVNALETGELDGGLADSADQRVALEATAVIWTAAQLAFDFVDVSGAGRPHSALFAIAALVLAVIAIRQTRRSELQGRLLLVSAVVTACVAFIPVLSGQYERIVTETWELVGSPGRAPFGNALRINTNSDAVQSWFGPLGLLLVVLAPIIAAVLRLRGAASTPLLVFALAPLLLLLTFSFTIVWDPWRGRFFIFGIALAAATWGILLRWPAIAGPVAAIGTTAFALALANHMGKPSGLGELWEPKITPLATTQTIWGAPRWDAQTRLRPGEGEDVFYRFLETRLPEEASVSLAVRGNDFVFPYFGPELSRHVTLVKPGGRVPAEAEWLVISPFTRATRCPESWRTEFTGEPSEQSFRLERRIAPDRCFSD